MHSETKCQGSGLLLTCSQGLALWRRNVHFSSWITSIDHVIVGCNKPDEEQLFRFLMEVRVLADTVSAVLEWTWMSPRVAMITTISTHSTGSCWCCAYHPTRRSAGKTTACPQCCRACSQACEQQTSRTLFWTWLTRCWMILSRLCASSQQWSWPTDQSLIKWLFYGHY